MNLKINGVYKFNTLAPSILGEEYTLMKVKSIMSSEEAVKYRDIATLNSQLVNSINGLSLNANDNTYILFENNDGTKLVLAYEWIDSNTIESVSSINIRVDIPNKDNTDIEVIKKALLELGYKGLKIYTY